ncbi:MAG: saccharopine dehydrogenase family protein [Acidimicrobiales bacterium]
MARYVVAGLGAVGVRAARQVHSLGGVEALWLVGSDRRRAEEVAGAIGAPARPGSWDEAMAGSPDAVVFCGAEDKLVGADRLVERASAALDAGANVISTADGLEEVDGLLALDARARDRGRSVVAGAAFCPGLSCVLAVHAAVRMEEVTEIRVAGSGAGGPACRRSYRRSLSGLAHEWESGAWVSAPAGSGRELCWFPDPEGATDCYRADFAASQLLLPAFPEAQRISARRAGSRRERLGLGRPALHRRSEGSSGAIWVEVVGHQDGAVVSRVLGAYDRPAVAAGAVAALAAHWAVDGRLARTGAGGLAELVKDSIGFLGQLAERGVKVAVFSGYGS